MRQPLLNPEYENRPLNRKTETRTATEAETDPETETETETETENRLELLLPREISFSPFTAKPRPTSVSPQGALL